MKQGFLQRNGARGRRGVTLLEVIVATTILIVLGLLISVFFVHSKSYANTATLAATGVLFGGVVLIRILPKMLEVSPGEGSSDEGD